MLTFAWLGEVALMAEACTRLAPFFPYTPGPWRTGRRPPMDAAARARATAMLTAGAPINETCRAVGGSQGEVSALRRALERAGRASALCACGRPATHLGRCVVRRAREKAERVRAA